MGPYAGLVIVGVDMIISAIVFFSTCVCVCVCVCLCVWGGGGVGGIGCGCLGVGVSVGVGVGVEGSVGLWVCVGVMLIFAYMGNSLVPTYLLPCIS